MKPDLTRWNRAGLKRFLYVDGNAAIYLEALRQELFARLAGWDMELLGLELDKADDRKEVLKNYIEQFSKDHQRALDNYMNLNDNPGSISLEIVRSFARAAHVLTEHLDAYANEGFLGTATQWENVRRLVYGLDYHPAPPASAKTHLVLYVKPGQSGLVERGLQIKHTPEKGSPVIFETLEDVQVDSALNTLQLASGSGSQNDANKLKSNIQENEPLVLNRIVEDLKTGEPVIIESPDGLQPYLLKEFTTKNGCTALTLEPPISISGNGLLVHLKPTETLEVFEPVVEQNESTFSSLILEEAPDQLKKGDIVFIGKGNTGIYRKVEEIEAKGKKIKLTSDFKENPTDQSDWNYLVKFLETDHSDLSDCLVGIPEKLESLESKNSIYVRNGLDWPIDVSINAFTYINGKFKACKISSIKSLVELEVSKENYSIFKIDSDEKKVTIKATQLVLGFDDTPPVLSEIKEIWVPPSGNQWKWKIDNFINAANTLKVSTVQRIVSGDLCVMSCGSNLIAACVQTINEATTKKNVKCSSLTVDNWQPKALAKETGAFIRTQTTISGKFKEQVRLKDLDNIEEKLSGNELTLENTDAAKRLKQGQPIVVEQKTPTRQSFQTKIQSVTKDESTVTVTLASALPDEHEFIAANTVIHANVVSAGHGETQPERILGSGNATLSNQEFLFPVSNVSFVPDPTQVSGVKAAISVIVEGETWTQVSRFNQSWPTDIHYVVRMTEEGHLRIVFGDGTNGRRLPTGENNVRIAWRLGSGRMGNLDAGLLKKPAHPHPRVEAIGQPFPATGGNEMESVTSLRHSAPASLMTMERAVSVDDFAALAASHSSVWSARAELESYGNERVVRVTVVPAQGDPLDSALEKDLKEYLLHHAIPGVSIELIPYKPETLWLNITLYIDKKRFDREAVELEVLETLIQRFALEKRFIGTPVYLSDIYQCVEAIQGVGHSVCKFIDENGKELFDDTGNAVQSLEPGHDGVLHIPNSEVIQINKETTDNIVEGSRSIAERRRPI